jgi:hypothetical protein
MVKSARMPTFTDALGTAPRLLVWLGLGAGVVSIFIWIWLARRLIRGLLGRTQVPVRGGRYFLAIVSGGALGLFAVASLALSAALAGYRAFTTKTRVAEVQCIELQPQKLRLYYVAYDDAGKRGETQVFDVDGDEWTVGGEVLRWRPSLTALGLRPVHAVTRVEGRWQSAEDANRHRGTAHDLRAASTLGGWTWLKRHGQRGPMRWAVAGAHGSAVSQLPDRRALFDLFVTPDGYVLEKRSL